MNRITRIPRPTGYTHLARVALTTNDNKDKQRAINHLIKAYIEGNLLWAYQVHTNLRAYDPSAPKPTPSKRTTKKPTQEDNYTKYIADIKPIEFSTLAMVLGWAESKLEGKIEGLLVKRYEQGLGNQSGREIAQQEYARAIKRGLFQKSLLRCQTLDTWGNELQAVSRIKGYHAGTVMAANSALSNALLANKQAMDMVDKMLPNSGTQHSPNVVINNHNGHQTGDLINNQLLTPTMAVGLLESHKINLIPEGQALEAIYLKHDLAGLPEVRAIGSDAQGTKKYDVKDLMYRDSQPESAHDSRRADEFDIVDGQVE